MHKDTAFYNQASTTYSERRYPARSTDYVHAFFKRRLSVTIKLLTQYLPQASVGNQRTLLEIGCADGVVIRKIFDTLGGAYATYIGTDTAPEMIVVAKEKNQATPIIFKERNPQADFGMKDATTIVEIGVINYTDLDRELRSASEALAPAGHYICSLAGKGSLWDRFRKSPTGFAHFLTYEEYEKRISTRFNILETVPVGFRIPLIWRIPALARVIQACAELVFAPLVPNIFHEKIYVLVKK